MINLLGEVCCDGPDYIGVVQSRLFGLTSRHGCECVVTDVYKLGINELLLESHELEEEAEMSLFYIYEEGHTQQPDPEDLVDLDIVWVFNFEVECYEILKKVFDLFTDLRKKGVIKGFALERYVSEDIVEQN